MAKFKLPLNSIVKTGKYFKCENADEVNIRIFKIYRYNPDDDANPRVDTDEIDTSECGPMILDALLKIKNEIDTQEIISLENDLKASFGEELIHKKKVKLNEALINALIERY